MRDEISAADLVHVDVMDNYFVPNLTVGLPVVERIVAASPIPVDAHLMIADTDRWATAYAEAGCASVTFHAEASVAPVRLAPEIRSAGCSRVLRGAAHHRRHAVPLRAGHGPDHAWSSPGWRSVSPLPDDHPICSR